MKSSQLLQSLSLYCIVLLLIQTQCNMNMLRVNSKLGITAQCLLGSSLNQNELANLWNDLFTANRGQTCLAATMRAQVIASLKAEGRLPGQVEGKHSGNSKFAWIQKWGYDETAYLIDFLDPVFQKEIITAFKKLYTDVMNLSAADTAEYKDPFDIKKLITADNAHNAGKIDLKQLNKNYDPTLYGISANSVQLREAMKKWNWFIDIGQQDYAINFVMRYDINGDGRLNARELILGTIMHNKNAIGSGICTNCFQDIAQRLDAVFIYLDCNNDGFLTAEELWTNLPKLNRPDTKYNIFGIGNSDNIRTNAINDFVIKNGHAKDGSVSKDEWRNGVLLAYWDRQTSFTGVVEDNSRNLKSLRWDPTESRDTAAWNYMKDKVLADLIAKSQK